MIIRAENLPLKIECPAKEYIGACAAVTAIYNPNDGESYLKILHNIDTLAEIETIEHGFIKVLVENPLEGAVYYWGNHGKFWEKTGITCGYA